MPIHDYECQSCGKITEAIRHWRVEEIVCECGGVAKKIISCSGVNCANDDAAWIRSVTDVVPKGEDATSMDREFVKNPTRKNYKRWMESRNLRHLEPGERPVKQDNRKALDEVHREAWKRHMERKRVEI